ncbi:latent-transforming growth factor beta-binding protein 2-like isoform X1 [Polyodon spathula]|uniref:latent-transforming growth factor beta-binding protein 2-like isoform X1 n=1 Tax=Polyodon spathula TaxID=7913 RepID=UPI001B7E8C7E|nr:latent-transforming growth factor beta-binding protein 2-like isoform X1 [Polyodon spathula]
MFVLRMDRLRIFVLMVLVAMLIGLCDSQRDSGRRLESTGTRGTWSQSRARSQGNNYSARVHGLYRTNGPVTARVFNPSHSHTNGSHSGRANHPAAALLSKQENKPAVPVKSIVPTAPPVKDALPQKNGSTIAREAIPASLKQRVVAHSSRFRTRQIARQNPANNGDSKQKIAAPSRPVGPNVCGGRCCTGWAIAPGTNRCIKPDCNPPCQNRGSCSRPQTCVCRSGFQGFRCEERAPEQVYVLDGSSRVYQPVRPATPLSDRRKTGNTQKRNDTGSQTESATQASRQRPVSTGQGPSTTHDRRGQAGSSSQHTGASRTVKRYPSSTGQITSNALPNGNHNQPASGLGTGNLNNAVEPRGANLTANIDRIKIVFTPMICKRSCNNGQCYNSCEKGDTTTVYSENTQSHISKAGFRIYFCQIPCMNGGRCIGRDQCWCPSNSTGKFCHLPAPHPEKQHAGKGSSHTASNSSHSMYTLPLSNQLASIYPSLVNVHIQHPPEAGVEVHQVAHVKPGQVPPRTQENSVEEQQPVLSVQQMSQLANGNGHSEDHSHTNGNSIGNENGHSRPQNRLNGYIGRCFQETIDGQCGKPLPGLTKQDDCCGSIGASWGLNRCTQCPSKPAYPVIANGLVECPKGYKRMNQTHCQDINECLMPGICKNAECLNSRGSYRCTCKPGHMLDTSRSHCISDKAVSMEREMCFRSLSGSSCSLPLTQHITKQICCCSRVGKAWGKDCQRCPLPDTDHFKEICPAGHGYTYSRSDIQILMRQAKEEELAAGSDTRQHHHHTHDNGHETPRVPKKEQGGIGQTKIPPVVTEATLKYPVVKTTPDSPIHLDPEPASRDTAPINVATQVTEIDRCSATPTVCGPGACISVQGGYTCYCNPGYELNTLQTRCVDVDECEKDPCEGKGRCVNNAGSFSCYCHPGYSLVITQNKKTCQDINECDLPNICPGSSCINTAGSFSCDCENGYIKSRRGPCEDVDECRNPSACPSGRCVNTPGSFQCVSCGTGYKAVNGRCIDENECRVPGVCTNGRCINLEGSYRCSCSQGYETSSDGKSCKDINECATHNVCPNGLCTNTEGSYTCSNCRPGYRISSDGERCEDINECGSTNVCPNGVCTNTEGSFTCSKCRNGYRLSEDKQRCEDINECASPSMCPSGLCANMEGSYSCTACPSGYRVSADRQNCEDINECLSPDVCPSGICINTEGSFSCTNCRAGYRIAVDGRRCEDIDECALPDVCPNGVCRNNEGSYSCTICGTGYRTAADRSSCEDIDECALPDVCPNGLCRNNEGSFSCTNCRPGFRVSANGRSCEDIDECALPEVCHNGHCVNNEGSYSCTTCGTGYKITADGFSCEDVNECSSPEICPSRVCVNTVGSFSCMACDSGYTVSDDRSKCEDINECEDISRSCLGGECTNTPGSFICACRQGFKLIGGTVCIDVNECLTLDICGSNGECMNSEGSYFCVCSSGYATTAHGVGCQDVDECREGSVCSRGQCLNSDGSYQCLCEAGFEYSQETRDCEDKDECKEYGSSVCGSWHCENTLGSYRCFKGCQPGFNTGPDGECDIDECINETICGSHGFCENTDGSYTCLCDRGFENPPGTPGCVDINECEVITAVCGTAFCENVEGTFLCICSGDDEEFDPETSQCRSRALIGYGSVVDTPVVAASSGERKECYYNLDDANFCENVLSRNTTKQECCCTVGSGWGDDCEIHPCPITGGDEYNELCPQGNGFLSMEGTSFGFGQLIYKDADECVMFGSEICKNGLCANIEPGYSCYCRVGYYYDTIRLECVDHNECQEEDTCVDGECVNTPGSFNCFCSPPLVLDVTRRRCINANFTSDDLDSEEDIHLDICWEEVSSEYMCSRPLTSRRTTYTECCCLYGVAWSNDCAFCPMRSSADYAALCNLPRTDGLGADGLRDRPGYEYGPDGPLYGPGYLDLGNSPYYNNPGPEYGPQDPVPLTPFRNPSNEYEFRGSPPLRTNQPQDFQPQFVNPYADRFDGFEGLQAEECGILNGCENGRCVRVREGYTCDCFDGFELDLNKMLCIDINECKDISEQNSLCKNGRCVNTEGSYKCVCLPGFLASPQPDHCIPEEPKAHSMEAEQ